MRMVRFERRCAIKFVADELALGAFGERHHRQTGALDGAERDDDFSLRRAAYHAQICIHRSHAPAVSFGHAEKARDMAVWERSSGAS